MKARNRLVVSINFYDEDIKNIEEFYKSHRYTHAEIYKRGLEGFKTDLEVDADLKTRAKKLVK